MPKRRCHGSGTRLGRKLDTPCCCSKSCGLAQESHLGCSWGHWPLDFPDSGQTRSPAAWGQGPTEFSCLWPPSSPATQEEPLAAIKGSQFRSACRASQAATMGLHAPAPGFQDHQTMQTWKPVPGLLLRHACIIQKEWIGNEKNWVQTCVCSTPDWLSCLGQVNFFFLSISVSPVKGSFGAGSLGAACLVSTFRTFGVVWSGLLGFQNL